MLILIRHTESEHNVKRVFDSNINSKSHLTEKGVEDMEKTSLKIRDYLDSNSSKVDRIFCSPILRTVECTRIFKDVMKDNDLYNDDRFCIDYRLREIEMGEFDNKSVLDYPYGEWNFNFNDEIGGENTQMVKVRSNDFLNSLNNFNINVAITHGEIFRRIYNILINDDIKPKKGEIVIIENKKVIFQK